MTYTEYKNQRQDEFNALPIFYAFSNEQFKRQMERFGLSENDTDQICRIGDIGGFCLKKDLPTIKAFLEKPDPLFDLMKDPGFAESAFYYEMGNHEYHINWQADWDVCSCFGNPEYSEDKNGADYLYEMGYDKETITAYFRARLRFLKDADEKGWY